MNKFQRIFKTEGKDSTKEMNQYMKRGELALDMFINNAKIKLSQKESELDTLNLRFVKGDTGVIPCVLSLLEDLDLLSTEIDRCEAYKAEMFLKEKE